MKVNRIESFLVPPRWCFVRVESDDEWVGWGEAIIPKRARAVQGAIEDLAQNIVLGSDPDRIEDLILRMRGGGFFRRGPVLATAMAGIEQALWDMKGKRYGLPILQFLGGSVRESVQAYAGVGGETVQSVLENTQTRIADGFRAVKLGAPQSLHYVELPKETDLLVEQVAELRNAWPTLGIAVDFHGRIHRALARKLAHALAPYDLLWIEEGLLPEHDELQPSIFEGIPVTLATGERLVDRWAFKSLLPGQRVDIWQPDVSITGLFELEKIARMAEAYDITAAPHCPNGPLSLAATLQVDAVLSNVVWQEYNSGINQYAPYLNNPEMLAVRRGSLYASTEPGLGVTVNEDAVRKAAGQPLVGDPDWRHFDGTYAEW